MKFPNVLLILEKAAVSKERMPLKESQPTRENKRNSINKTTEDASPKKSDTNITKKLTPKSSTTTTTLATKKTTTTPTTTKPSQDNVSVKNPPQKPSTMTNGEKLKYRGIPQPKFSTTTTNSTPRHYTRQASAEEFMHNNIITRKKLNSDKLARSPTLRIIVLASSSPSRNQSDNEQCTLRRRSETKNYKQTATISNITGSCSSSSSGSLNKNNDFEQKKKSSLRTKIPRLMKK